VVGSVEPGPQVFGRGDAGQGAQLIDQMRLVSVAVKKKKLQNNKKKKIKIINLLK